MLINRVGVKSVKDREISDRLILYPTNQDFKFPLFTLWKKPKTQLPSGKLVVTRLAVMSEP